MTILNNWVKFSPDSVKMQANLTFERDCREAARVSPST